MERDDLALALRRMSVETGSLVCLGCGHEHNCSIHGCAVLRMAAGMLANDQRHVESLQRAIEDLRKQVEMVTAERKQRAAYCLTCKDQTNDTIQRLKAENDKLTAERGAVVEDLLRVCDHPGELDRKLTARKWRGRRRNREHG